MSGRAVGVVRIDDADDDRLAPYRDIRERDLVGREGRFVAEGKVVLRVLLGAARFAPESVLVLESRLAGLAGLLDAVPRDVPVYVVDAATIDRVAGFHVHRGILAIGRRRAVGSVEDLIAALPRRALVVAAVGIANHDNLGAIFRNAAAFEADAVLLDAASCDPLYRKAIRVSVGATLTVPFERARDGADLAGLLARNGFRTLALSPGGETDIAEIAPDGRTALFLGTEGEGLPTGMMARMQTVRIAMAAGFDSLNVAAASAIALHRLWRGGVSGRTRPP